MMSDSERARGDELVAIPRLAERVGVTPRVLRYWEEQGLISPTREHGKLRYSPRDVAIAALIRKLLEAGAGVEGVRMLKRLAERDIRRSSSAGDETALIEAALQVLYQRVCDPTFVGHDDYAEAGAKRDTRGLAHAEWRAQDRQRNPAGNAICGVQTGEHWASDIRRRCGHR